MVDSEAGMKALRDDLNTRLLLLGPGKLSLDAWIRSALRRRCAGQASQHAAGEPMTCPKTP